jgi:hypothetical protein
MYLVARKNYFKNISRTTKVRSAARLAGPVLSAASSSSVTWQHHPPPNPVNPSRKCRHHGSYAWFIHFKLIQYNPRWKCRELASFSYYATSERHKISGFIGLFPDPDLSKQTITHADLLILRTKWYTFHMGVVSFNFPAVCGGTCLSLLENCFDSQIQVVLLLRRV